MQYPLMTKQGLFITRGCEAEEREVAPTAARNDQSAAEEVLLNAHSPAPGSLAEALAQIPDPRRSHLRVHGLVAVLQMAVAAMLCGARSLYAIAQWGTERREDDSALLVDLG